MQQFKFNLSVDKETGRFLAAYLQVRKGKRTKTIEATSGVVFADYDGDGCLLGIEILGPCENCIVDRIVPI